MEYLKNYKKTEVNFTEVKVKSNFDYSEFSEKEKEILIELEERMLHSKDILATQLKKVAEILFEAQEIFANNKNGSFGKWYENLGYKKDFVYMCLDRKNLALKYDNKEIYQLPERAVKDLKKFDKKEEKEIILDILTDPAPIKKLKEIKEIEKQKQDKNKQKEEIDPNQTSLFEVEEKVEEVLSVKDKNINEKIEKEEITEVINQEVEEIIEVINDEKLKEKEEIIGVINDEELKEKEEIIDMFSFLEGRVIKKNITSTLKNEILKKLKEIEEILY